MNLKIYLGQTVAEKYGPSGKTCLGGAVFPTDYLTDVAMGWNASQVKAQKRSSMVFEVQLVITERGLVLPGKLDHPVTFKIPVDNTTFQVDQVLQCATWNENMWSGDSCTTEEFLTLNSQMYLVCKCSILGYYTVLVTSGSATRRPHATTAVTTTEMISTQKTILRASADPTTENMYDSSSAASILSDNTQNITCKNLSPSDRQDGVPISSEAYSISFRIEEDFNSTVGKQREQFKQKLRCEILAVDPQIPTRMIQGIDLSPGSIIVTVRLVDTDVKTAKEVIPAIAQVIQNGDLNLHDLGNRKLNVPAQTVTIIEPYKPEKSNAVVYAVVGSVIVSTLGIISLVTGAVIIKRKKETEKMMQQIPAVKDGIPSYRQFQFEQSIEGTEASLARYHSNYPTMGTAGTLVLGVNSGAIPGGRYERQVTGSQYMHPDISCNASQTSEKEKKKKKKKKQQGTKQAGSQNDPLNQEGIPPGDQDSGIVDGCTNVSEDRNMRKRNWDRKVSNGSAMEFDILPGTPNEDS